MFITRGHGYRLRGGKFNGDVRINFFKTKDGGGMEVVVVVDMIVVF